MTPVIRIDDEVMEEIKKRAIELDLVFGTPNEVLRAIFALDGKGQIEPGSNALEIQLSKIYSPRKWALIPVPKDKRSFFPGFKVNFELVTNEGTVTTHVTSDAKGTPIGDPEGGAYIQTGLRSWYDKHPELKDGAKLRMEALEPGKRYRLSVVSP